MVTTGSFNDSFQELGLSVLLQRDGLITDISGNFIRTRDPVCVETEQFLASLTGKLVTELDRKDIRTTLGGAEGCVHLVDITNDVCKAVTVALEQTDPAG